MTELMEAFAFECPETWEERQNLLARLRKKSLCEKNIVTGLSRWDL
jgi:hypothetical protein